MNLLSTIKTKLKFIDGQSRDKSCLTAIYDLEVSPITYDYFFFLTAAELERQNRGLDRLKVVVAPARNDIVRKEEKEYDASVTREQRIWRINHILLSAQVCFVPNADFCYLSSRISLLDFSGKSNIFPYGYRSENLTSINDEMYATVNEKLFYNGTSNLFRASAAAKSFLHQWIAYRGIKKRIIAITIRGYGYNPDRNSNLAAWIEFAKQVDKKKYEIVFIPDTDAIYSEQFSRIDKEFQVFREAALNLDIRLAIYEFAYVNMSVLTGPASLMILNSNCDYLLFKIVVSIAPQTTEEKLASYGFETGKSPHYATIFQKWVWKDDDAETLVFEFHNFEKLKDKSI